MEKKIKRPKALDPYSTHIKEFHQMCKLEQSSKLLNEQPLNESKKINKNVILSKWFLLWVGIYLIKNAFSYTEVKTQQNTKSFANYALNLDIYGGWIYWFLWCCCYSQRRFKTQLKAKVISWKLEKPVKTRIHNWPPKLNSDSPYPTNTY